ncbi:unnamed protein product [Boreogadus saida]
MAAGCGVSLSSPGGVQVLVSFLIFAASCASPNISDASSSPWAVFNTTLNTTLNTTRQTTSNTTAVPSGVEEDGGGLLGAGLVALLSMLSVVAVLSVLVALSRTLGFPTPPFERLDDVPLESPNEESPFAHKY